MTIRATGHCRWTALAASLAAACAPCTLVAAPVSPSAATGLNAASSLEVLAAEIADQAPGGEELYLEVWLNQSSTGQLARFVMLDGRPHASAATLRELGLVWPGSDTASGLLPLDTIPGLQAHYDASLQKMMLTAPVEMLGTERARFSAQTLPPSRVDPATRAPGLLLNYDLYAQGDGDAQSFSGWHELRLFGVGAGVWSNSILSRLVRAPGRDDVHESVRLDTLWQLDLPDSMVSVVAGDTITAGLSWTRATRIGGLRASRNFSLQPYRVTTPLASFAGEAVLPSTVDLFINGIRQSSQQVAPGQFQIDSIPVINGAGQAQMVVTDINGRSQVVNFPLYNSTQLLRAGLTDWSAATGLVRREYGLSSFSYSDDPMASATFRHGLSNSITIEAHVEGTKDVQMTGVGGALRLGQRGGLLDLSLAGSRDRSASGYQYGAGYQWISSLFNVNFGTLRRSDGFADVASLEGAVLPRRMDRIFAGVSLPLGQLGAGYVRQDQPGLGRSRYASLSWSRQLPLDSYLSLSLNRDIDNDGGNSAYLFWSVPLGRRTYVSATASRANSRDRFGIEASRPVDSDLGGWGWRAQASAGDSTLLQAQVSRLHRFGQWDAGIFRYGGQDDAPDSTIGFASASGSLLLMEGRMFAMRRVYDAFALVSTDGIPDVPILLENRVVGLTDEDGLLLVSRLNAWQNNRLAIDPLKAPMDVRLGRTEMQAVPWNGSGMLARFPMRYMASVQAKVTDSDGEPLPAGSPVWLPDADPAIAPATTVVGFDGLLYLQDPPANARIRIRHDDRYCEVVLPKPARDRGANDLGEVVCR